MIAFFIIIIIVVTSFFIWLKIQPNKKKDNLTEDNVNPTTQTNHELLEAMKYLKKNPKDKLGIMYLAKRYYELELYEQAASYINQFLESDLTKMQSVEIKALILGFDCMCKLKNINIADNYIQKGYNLDSTNIEVLKRLIKLKYARGDFTTTIDLSKKTLVIAPHLFEGHFYLGMSYYQLENWAEALKNLEIASSIEAGDFIIAFSLGKIHNQLNERQKALTYFTHAARLAPSAVEHANVIYQEGCLLKNMGELAKAEIDFKNCFKESTREEIRLLALMSIIEIEKDSKNIHKIIFYIKEYLKIKPESQRYLKDLEHYSELAYNKMLCDIKLKGKSEFLNICIEITKILEPALEISYSNLLDEQTVEIVAIEKNTPNNQKVIIRFIRTSNLTGIIPVTNLYEQMKEISAKRCQFISDDSFTEEALLFAQMRTIELTAKKELLPLLNQVVAERERKKINTKNDPREGNTPNNNN